MMKLNAPDGKYYTQAATVPAAQRLFCTTVFLGKNDSAINWRLADETEKKAVEAEVKAARAAKMKEAKTWMHHQ